MNARRKLACWSDARAALQMVLMQDAMIETQGAEVGDPFRLFTTAQRTWLTTRVAALTADIDRVTAKLDGVSDD